MADDVWTSAVMLRLDAETESVRHARRFVAEALDDLDDGRASDAALLTSELATNAVIHARSAYVVTVRRGDDDRVRVEVSDSSAVVARRNRYSATSGTGRGLAMVEDVAAAWGVVEADGGDGKVVWFELAPSGGVERSGAEATSAEDDEPDLDALIADLGGGWEDDTDAGRGRSLRRAA